ncbi:hypothetical protein QA811_02045 [Streptomyces sp. B21-102]|uniref:hypothetical protein n=1 Tax=Streptomyces sp. B21-102 TaxID=3039416 RepID=UPI002FF165C2
MSLRLITSAPSSDAAYRTGLIRQYLAAADWAIELHLLAEASDYDRANPGAPSLTDELVGSRLPAAA